MQMYFELRGRETFKQLSRKPGLEKSNSLRCAVCTSERMNTSAIREEGVK